MGGILKEKHVYVSIDIENQCKREQDPTEWLKE